MNSSKRAEAQKYLETLVNPILQPMVQQLINKQPDRKNLPKFCLAFLEEWNKNPKPTQFSKKDLQQDDIIDQIQLNKKIAKRNQKISSGRFSARQAVCSEVYGTHNRSKPKSNFTQKSQQTKKYLRKLISDCFLFSQLNDDGKQEVIRAMEMLSVNPNQKVIKEGDIGESLYLISEGTYDCFKFIDKKLTHLKAYKPGDVFGELALLYNTPRQATIIAKTSGKLYKLHRSDFSTITQEYARKKRDNYTDVLSKIQILSQFTENQREKIADILKQQKFKPGDYIFKQGDNGSDFYFVIQGKLVAEKKGQKVYEYKVGDYFGQIALLKDTPRQASIKAVTTCKVAYLGRDSFKRLLGQLEERLQKNQEKYSKYLS